ncbi:hypothetical protein [Salinisphaera sp.]|uniref:hypothetical protein n=1 Tax=Salinisphaera sp. TaxID=1914330 RepID=UPI002D797D0A|nr:hypothetical protein [Salinisphaera sp.]HET7313435.1 hypothetical protein [Salinisphaera sp.]
MAASGKKHTISYVNYVGDVTQSKTTNSGKIHVRVRLKAMSADYFRGTYNGVEKDLDTAAIAPMISTTIELPSGGTFEGLALSIGTLDRVTTNGHGNTNDQLSPWYKSNNYVGLSARFTKKWTAGITYTAYTSPSGLFATSQQITVASAYKNWLHPSIKFATAIDSTRNDGVYAQVGIEPNIKVFKNTNYPVKLSLPLSVGGGFNDFYSTDSDHINQAGFANGGVAATMPMKFIPSDYGSWKLHAGANVTARDDDLRHRSGEHTDDTFIPMGYVEISLLY